jgi:hypothetical protein
MTIFGSRLRILYGIFFIVLGIVTGVVTYRYVFPMGSIMLVLSGIILIFWKRWNYVVHCVMMKITGKEIKE